MDKDDIIELVNAQKEILQVIIEDNELRNLNAKTAKLAVDCYIDNGFSRQEAIQIVCASTKTGK